MDKQQPEVTIYTDGAAEPNPGAGGYGVVLLSGKRRKELAEGFLLTTNNRMELLAVIVGLETLNQPTKVTVYSDSKYVVDSVEKGYIHRWQSKNWMRTKTEQAKNADLWQRFLATYQQHQVTLTWVPGHKGIPENERCDQLAVAAAQSPDKKEDTGYQPSAPKSSKAVSDATLNAQATHSNAGEACRACGSLLQRRVPKKRKTKPGQTYYFAWYLHCSGCRRIYMVEAAKRTL